MLVTHDYLSPGRADTGPISPLSFCLLLGILLLTGCGGGGGGGDDGDEAPGDKVEISGAILIPGGAVSPANPIGLKGAASRPVSLYRIDDAGNIIGDVLDTATSDQDGNYVLLLPAEIEYSSDLIVEAQLGGGERARAIVIDETTDVSPITEYITQKLIADPAIDMSALPLAEVARLIAFVETLPIQPKPDLVAQLAAIAAFSDVAVEAQIDDLATSNPQIRLSGLLSVPGSPPPAPRPAPTGTAARDNPVPLQLVELYRINGAGDNVGAPVADATTNAEGVFTMLLPTGMSMSGDLRLQADVNGDVITALVTGETISIGAESHFVATKLLAEPNVDPAGLNINAVRSIVQFAITANCPEATTLAAQLNELDTCVGAEVSVLVDNAVNDVPVIGQGDAIGVTMDEDGAPIAFVAPLITATDTDSGTLTWSGSAATSGTASVSGTAVSSPTISYVPAADFSGIASFDVTVDDGNGGSDTITVNVTIDPVNDDPVIDQGDAIGVTMDEDGAPIAFVAPAISATDVEGNPLTWSGTAANSGTATVSGSGASPTITYVPVPGFNGVASFDAIVSDGVGGSATITINVTIDPVNDDPVIDQGDAIDVTMDEDGAPIAFVVPLITATDTDSGTLTWSGSAATSGTASVSGTAVSSPTISYVPLANFNGIASFDVTVDDGNGGSDTITVNVTIDPQNDLPTIGGTAATTAVEGVLYSFTPTADDVDGEALLFSIQNQPSWATGFDVSDGTLSGIPGPADVTTGLFSNIIISVTAGGETVDLPAFDITVNATAEGPAVWDQFDWDDGSTWQ
jgi:hypothetical protein